jgi:hypothetical protein
VVPTAKIVKMNGAAQSYSSTWRRTWRWDARKLLIQTDVERVRLESLPRGDENARVKLQNVREISAAAFLGRRPR